MSALDAARDKSKKSGKLKQSFPKKKSTKEAKKSTKKTTKPKKITKSTSKSSSMKQKKAVTTKGHTRITAEGKSSFIPTYVSDRDVNIEEAPIEKPAKKPEPAKKGRTKKTAPSKKSKSTKKVEIAKANKKEIVDKIVKEKKGGDEDKKPESDEIEVSDDLAKLVADKLNKKIDFAAILKEKGIKPSEGSVNEKDEGEFKGEEPEVEKPKKKTTAPDEKKGKQDHLKEMFGEDIYGESKKKLKKTTAKKSTKPKKIEDISTLAVPQIKEAMGVVASRLNRLVKGGASSIEIDNAKLLSKALNDALRREEKAIRYAKMSKAKKKTAAKKKRVMPHERVPETEKTTPKSARDAKNDYHKGLEKLDDIVNVKFKGDKKQAMQNPEFIKLRESNIASRKKWIEETKKFQISNKKGYYYEQSLKKKSTKPKKETTTGKKGAKKKVETKADKEKREIEKRKAERATKKAVKEAEKSGKGNKDKKVEEPNEPRTKKVEEQKPEKPAVAEDHPLREAIASKRNELADMSKGITKLTGDALTQRLADMTRLNNDIRAMEGFGTAAPAAAAPAPKPKKEKEVDELPKPKKEVTDEDVKKSEEKLTTSKERVKKKKDEGLAKEKAEREANKAPNFGYKAGTKKEHKQINIETAKRNLGAEHGALKSINNKYMKAKDELDGIVETAGDEKEVQKAVKEQRDKVNSYSEKLFNAIDNRESDEAVSALYSQYETAREDFTHTFERLNADLISRAEKIKDSKLREKTIKSLDKIMKPKDPVNKHISESLLDKYGYDNISFGKDNSYKVDLGSYDKKERSGIISKMKTSVTAYNKKFDSNFVVNEPNYESEPSGYEYIRSVDITQGEKKKEKKKIKVEDIGKNKRIAIETALGQFSMDNEKVVDNLKNRNSYFKNLQKEEIKEMVGLVDKEIRPDWEKKKSSAEMQKTIIDTSNLFKQAKQLKDNIRDKFDRNNFSSKLGSINKEYQDAVSFLANPKSGIDMKGKNPMNVIKIAQSKFNQQIKNMKEYKPPIPEEIIKRRMERSEKVGNMVAESKIKKAQDKGTQKAKKSTSKKGASKKTTKGKKTTKKTTKPKKISRGDALIRSNQIKMYKMSVEKVTQSLLKKPKDKALQKQLREAIDGLKNSFGEIGDPEEMANLTYENYYKKEIASKIKEVKKSTSKK